MSDTEKKHNNHWTYEKCYEVALKCSNRTEFHKKYSGAYAHARENCWLDDYNWFVRPKPNQKWTYEKCYEAALKCKSIKEFRNKYESAYNACLKNKWIKNFTWFERCLDNYTDKIHIVYGYFFNEQHTVYIGRTNNKEKRHKSHSTKDCPVKRFADSNNTVIPKMTILEDCLTLEESLIYEDLYVEQYKNDGWNLINTGKTGLKSGAIGQLKHKWTKESCLKAAKECKTRADFRRKYVAAYRNAHKNGWIDSYTWFIRPKTIDGYWQNYDNCYKAALKCKSRTELNHKYYQAYDISRKNGWLDEFFPKVAA